jgi:RNA polymerase sigma factor (sigma-70 family)
MPLRTSASSYRSDEALVKECLDGNQDAWVALLEKYKNLIYSIPFKYGIARDDANDIFQQTCVQLLGHLGQLRDAKSVAAWLIKVTTHLCIYWTSRESRMESADMDLDFGRAPEMPEDLLRKLEEEQLLRDAMSRLDPRCRELLRLLFFETPSMPYAALAKQFGLASGSIGFTRLRCLQQLRRLLEEGGLRE